jgi:hypothetical protein
MSDKRRTHRRTGTSSADRIKKIAKKSRASKRLTGVSWLFFGAKGVIFKMRFLFCLFFVLMCAGLGLVAFYKVTLGKE